MAKETYITDDILQKRPIILRSLLIVATPYHMLQNAATCCNMLQFNAIQLYRPSCEVHKNAYNTATRCNTLQHAATRSNTLQDSVTRHTVLQSYRLSCEAHQNTYFHCNTLQHAATCWNTPQHSCIDIHAERTGSTTQEPCKYGKDKYKRDLQMRLHIELRPIKEPCEYRNETY